MITRCPLHALVVFCVTFPWALAADEQPQKSNVNASDKFQVGVADCDLTPQAPMPMWGYAARHAALSNGVMDPLMAKAIVIQAGGAKLALVGTDLGRGPTIAMMEKIRDELRSACGIEHVIISGSHSHHGPVIELTDQEGFGKGRFDDAVAYARQLPDRLIAVIKQANDALQPARLGVATKNVSLNRNRHSKRQPKPTDPMLAVMRFDDQSGKPIAILVNFAAHPTMTDAMILKYSADYPGAMKAKVEASTGAKCIFMQGAAGDMSPNPPAGVDGPRQFGEALADQVLEISSGMETAPPEHPSIEGKVNHFLFDSRVDFSNKVIVGMFARAFFPELATAYVAEVNDGLLAEMNTILLNREIGLVSGSGEFFCNHSNRLKERSYLKHTLFFGYANGHNLYFPTIEAASEGGYGADPTMSPVQLGAGEQMMNQALLNLYGMLGKFSPEPALKAKRDKLARN
jgi:hypothetical protein